MFERFTDPARAAVVGAQSEARALGHSWIGTEHLLLAVLARPDSPVARAMGDLGITEDAVRARVLAEVGAGPVDDAAALADLGIDLEAVRRRAEERFGPGALDRPGPARRRSRLGRPRRLGRRRGCAAQGSPTGHIPFCARAKKSLELALRESLAAGCREIREQHLVLGIVRSDGLAARIVGELGVPTERVRAALRDLGEAA
jgi:ATP-dependent Clp protease ATP-binding subunit ClpA